MKLVTLNVELSAEATKLKVSAGLAKREIESGKIHNWTPVTELVEVQDRMEPTLSDCQGLINKINGMVANGEVAGVVTRFSAYRHCSLKNNFIISALVKVKA